MKSLRMATFNGLPYRAMSRQRGDAGERRSAVGGGDTAREAAPFANAEVEALKLLDITEFYSERGGGVRSHLSTKSQVSCQLGVDHVIVAPGRHDEDTGVAIDANEATQCSRATRARNRARSTARRPSPSLRPHVPLAMARGQDPRRHRPRAPRRARDPFAVRRSDGRAGGAARRVRRSRLRVALGLHRHVRARALRRSRERAARVGGVRAALGDGPRHPKRCEATYVASQWQREKLVAHRVPRVVHAPFGIERRVFTPAARSDARRREIVGRFARGTGRSSSASDASRSRSGGTS